MAGMLPGVEAARRRRVHQSSHTAGVGLGAVLPTPSCSSSRRTSFSLFCSTSYSSSSVQQRCRTQPQADDKLGQLARQAKERLDERLRAQRKSTFATRGNNEERSSNERVDGQIRELRREVYGGGGGGRRKKGWWRRTGWKAVEQEECAVCLEEFKVGDNLVNMPCDHTFHSTCLVPWLHTNTHCPCCRTSIFS